MIAFMNRKELGSDNMQKDNKFFEDVAKMASGAAGGLLEMKREMTASMHEQLEKLLQNMNLATSEEFETIKAMFAKLSREQEEMKARLEALEKKLP